MSARRLEEVAPNTEPVRAFAPKPRLPKGRAVRATKRETSDRLDDSPWNTRHHCGMGEVYRAEDTVLERDVAVKLVDVQWLRDGETVLLLRKEETKFGTRLLQEAQAMAKLNHRNICQFYDVVPFGDELAIVMGYIPGDG
jgi:hypothetical protein